MIGGLPRGKVLLLLSVALHVVAALTAVGLARKQSTYRPIAAFLGVTALADVLLVGAILAGAPTSVPPAPLLGWTRVAGHARQACYLTWPFGLVALNVAVFAKRKPWPVAVAYVGFLVMLVLGYPTIRGDVLRQAYLVTEIGSVLISFGLLVQWGCRHESWSMPQLALLFLIFGEAGVLYAAWRGDIFAGWDTARILYCSIYAMLAALQGYADTGSGHSEADRAATRRRGERLRHAPCNRSSGALPERAPAFSDINEMLNAAGGIDDDEPFDPDAPDVKPEAEEKK